jgi:hypothetical protein
MPARKRNTIGERNEIELFLRYRRTIQNILQSGQSCHAENYERDPLKIAVLSVIFTNHKEITISGIAARCSLVAVVMLALAAPDNPPKAQPSVGLSGKVIAGYQGWFGCPGDFAGNTSWIHWFRDNVPDAAHLRVELMPDTAEYPPDSLCETDLRRPDGSRISVYSAQSPGAVDLHFRWMAQYGIDGAAVQRFVVNTTQSQPRARADHLLANEVAAAEHHGRGFYVTYDVSGGNPATVTQDIERDWRHLTADLHVTASPQYIRERGKPVLELWGFGFLDRPGRPEEVSALQTNLERGEGGLEAVTLIGGVPPEWRTLDGSSKRERAWATVYRQFDILSPWSTGRYNDAAGAAKFVAQRVVPDLEETRRLGIGYLPVVFPGFSWSNLSRLDRGRAAPVNQIPRVCGRFEWTAIRQLLAAHVNMIYVAMFDEVDEGTAVFKLESRAANLPVGAALLSLEADGCTAAPDLYLGLSGAAGPLIRSGRPN